MKRIAVLLAGVFLAIPAHAELSIANYRDYADSKLEDYQRGFFVGYLVGMTEQMQQSKIPWARSFNNGQGTPLGCNIPSEVRFNLSWAESVLQQFVKAPDPRVVEQLAYNQDLDKNSIWSVLIWTIKVQYPCPKS